MISGVVERQGTANLPAGGTKAKRYTGEVVYIYAFDLAYDMSGMPVGQLLGQPLAQFTIDTGKRTPKHLAFYRPQMVRLPPHEQVGPHGLVRVERVIKLLPIGAISITVRVPFAVAHVEDLVAYHDLQLGAKSLHDEVRELAEEVRQELMPCFVRPVPQLSEEEAYTVFCIEAPVTNRELAWMKAETWLQSHRRQVAALLTQETDLNRLSEQEAEESTGRSLSYYEDDLVVVDWDAALVIDEKGHFEETLHIMELANLQLAEFEAYDRILDAALDRSYRDLRVNPWRSRWDVLNDLREIRIDLARMSDELSNITKFFGDWHLARIYQSISARFHLADWHRTIDEKLQTLDNFYQLFKHDQTNRWMLILETTIVLLFIIDLLVLFMGLQKP
ncbi:MAG: hypothetical protein U1G07_02235 [Verrucomicrobiota bacterium]